MKKDQTNVDDSFGVGMHRFTQRAVKMVQIAQWDILADFLDRRVDTQSKLAVVVASLKMVSSDIEQFVAEDWHGDLTKQFTEEFPEEFDCPLKILKVKKTISTKNQKVITWELNLKYFLFAVAKIFVLLQYCPYRESRVLIILIETSL